MALSSLTHAETSSRPNILIILADDIGYSDIGAFGAEIKTPHLDRLAKRGKVFTQFYNMARCCPTRASLLTGLYPHQAGIGHLILKTPHAGYQDYLSEDSITLAEVLQTAGYRTYLSGKWHLAPRSYDPKNDAEHWPLQRGFDKFYGTIAGSGSFYDPLTLCRGETFITPENDQEYQPGAFYYTDAISDNATKFLKAHLEKFRELPFFMYVAYTAPHWPLHAPEDAIRPYHSTYDEGYEAIFRKRLKRINKLNFVPELGAVAPPVGNWSEVENAAVEAALMETYAAMVSRMDEGIGRIVNTLGETGELENTLIFYLQDNGACAEDWFWEETVYHQTFEPLRPDERQTESSPPMQTRDGRPVRTGHDVYPGPADTFTAYKENWANVSNAPFRKYKHYVHEGGISTPLIVHWPSQIDGTSSPRIVREPAHVVDIMATCLDFAGAGYPEYRNGVKLQPLAGISLAPSLTGSGTIDRTDPLYWEHESNRAIRDGKWKLVALAGQPWELYDMSCDRGEMNDLADQYPELVEKLSVKWNDWAERSKVLPLGGWKDKPSSRSKRQAYPLVRP